MIMNSCPNAPLYSIVRLQVDVYCTRILQYLRRGRGRAPGADCADRGRGRRPGELPVTDGGVVLGRGSEVDRCDKVVLA